MDTSSSPTTPLSPSVAVASGTSRADPFRQTFSSAKRRSTEFVGRFRQIDFKKEVWPLDSVTAKTLTSEAAFWAVALLAALPLFFTTLERSEYQLVAFAVFFAAIWGLIFRFSVVPRVKIGWGWLTATLLFTGTAGVFLLMHLVYPAMPAWYVNLPDPQNALVFRLLGSVFQTGVLEESCKIVPVAILMILLRKRLNYSDIVMLGSFSGLGFAAFENLGYIQAQPEKVFNAFMPGSTDPASIDPNSVPAALHTALIVASQSAILLALSRTISCTFGHAVYSGIFAHFLAQGRGAGIKQIPLWIVGLMVAAVFHGLYDWLGDIQTTLPVVTDVISFMLLKLYIAQARNNTTESNQLTPLTSELTA